MNIATALAGFEPATNDDFKGRCLTAWRKG